MVGANGTPRGAAAFSRLARSIVRRPFVPIAAWLVLLAVAAPFLSHLGAVTTNSTETLPSNAPSAIADAKLAQLFPNATVGSSSTLLFYGPNVVGPTGQDLVLNVTAALRADRSLVDVASVDSVYTDYAAYLAGETQLAAGVVAAAQAGSPNVTVAINETAVLLWGPPTRFVENWVALVHNSSNAPNASNEPAYNETALELASSTEGLEILSMFYGGYNGSATGFNGTAADCAAEYPSEAAVVQCADSSARTNVLPLLPHLAGTNVSVDGVVLAGVGIENSTNTSAQRNVAGNLLAEASGLPASWIVRVWARFDGLPVTPGSAAAYANASVASTTLADEPLPVPLALASQFVNAAGTASLVSVSFTVADDATNASGGDPVNHDLGEIDHDVARVLATSDPHGTILYYQTGDAPLDQLTNQAVDSVLGLVLPLTVGLLLGITMLYFRSPVAPLVAFGGLAIALLLGLGATVLLGTIVTHIDTTALTLEEVFVLGVGTDYSIFLVARYREELVRGRPSDEAIVTAVTWAGQSVATSGSTAIIVTVALAFSGVALLSQWGMVLSVAILIAMLASLTLLPALLKLLGPRVFWPMTGARFVRAARKSNERTSRGATYFYRAARASERRPGWVVGAIVLVSVPLVAVALQAPVSYDFYGQLPSGHDASNGLAQLGQDFGPGYAVPSYALVTFSSPLLVGNTTNATEFTDLAELGLLASTTSGIAAARSPVGPYGADLTSWLALASEPEAERTNLLATLGPYVGTDGRTVLLQLQTNDTGLSYGAVTAVDQVQSAFDGYASSHPEITGLAFGGGAPVIGDLAQETALATEVMLIAVTVGLVLVLLVVLRSWIIALMGVATIGLSISWAWALSDLVLQKASGIPIFFYVRTLLIMLVLGLGIDYNIFLLTRVREERIKGRSTRAATVEAVGRTGGIITAAAVILASAFGALLVGEFTLIRAIGFSVAIAVVMDAMIVRTYFVPASLQLLGERVWVLLGRRPGRSSALPASPPATASESAGGPT
jgi:RND superfamily putative drug exporter